MFSFALTHAYLIPLFPALAFLLIGPFTRHNKNLSAAIAIFMMGLSTALSVCVALATQAFSITMETPFVMKATWATIGHLPLTMGVFIDPLTAMMLVVVSVVSLLVFIYSASYMHSDPGTGRFFAFISLFSASMLALCGAVSFLQLYVFWEGVGLCSYLLIGFYYEKVSAREAAKKAFITTRIGDFGLLIGIILLAVLFGTTDFLKLREMIPAYVLGAGTTTITVISILLFMGAIGKSGQFPLHVWLLDAMEGPTPASALIHAATMVAAGVFLVARAFFIFSESPIAMDFITFIGTFTAFFAACIAVTQTKFKSVLAYSTISQLGYMMCAVGLGAMTASMFHLMTHAFFKALLFLCAGAIMHVLHEETNIFKMGGLYKKMPLTFICMVIAVLAISGIPPFSGFFSKDEILAVALNVSTPVYVIMMFTSFLTAFYMTRLLVIAFLGESHSEYEAHEVDSFMRWPMLLFAVLTVTIGIACYYGGFGLWVYDGAPVAAGLDPAVGAAGTIVGLIGIGMAYWIYGKDRGSSKGDVRRRNLFYQIVYNKFYVDEFYAFLRTYLVYAVAYALDWIDRKVFGGMMDVLGTYALGSSDYLTGAAYDGQVQRYIVFFYTGVVILLIVALYWTIRILSFMGGAIG